MAQSIDMQNVLKSNDTDPIDSCLEDSDMSEGERVWQNRSRLNRSYSDILPGSEPCRYPESERLLH